MCSPRVASRHPRALQITSGSRVTPLGLWSDLSNDPIERPEERVLFRSSTGVAFSHSFTAGTLLDCWVFSLLRRSNATLLAVRSTAGARARDAGESEFRTIQLRS